MTSKTFLAIMKMMAPEAVFKTMNFFTKIIIFLKEVRLEIRKINWPTRQKTIRYTIIVLGVSAAVAMFLGGLDFVFTMLLNKFVL